MRLATKRIVSLLKKYLMLCGLTANLLLVVALLLPPDLMWKGKNILFTKPGISVAVLKNIQSSPKPSYSLDQEISANFPAWKPLAKTLTTASYNIVYSTNYPSLQAAADQLKEGDVLRIARGIYSQGLVIRANNIIIEGEGHVVLERASKGKAAIVNKGNFNQIRNIECRYISVPDRNGACVRHEGKNIKLYHVYFHDSQQGILAGGTQGIIEIENSRFESLGYLGQAHGIYVNGDLLSIKNSLIIASKSEGHEIKSRAKKTIIDQSVIASLSSNDSRLIDVPNGGELIITRSVLQQGPQSSNQDVIGYGLEGMKYNNNKLIITDNIFLLERRGGNLLINLKNNNSPVVTKNNVVISTKSPDLKGVNFFFDSRQAAGLDHYPALPPVYKD